MLSVRRREFMTLLGGAAVAWPVAARAQQPAMPVVGFVSGRSPGSDAYLVEGFRQGLRENGFTEGQNVALEFRWADGRLDRLPAMAGELIERKVAVLFAGAADVATGALRVASAIVPVVFAMGSDPVETGLQHTRQSLPKGAGAHFCCEHPVVPRSKGNQQGHCINGAEPPR
jgi:putative ABC transport system substrate-binding protein